MIGNPEVGKVWTNRLLGHVAVSVPLRGVPVKRDYR